VSGAGVLCVDLGGTRLRVAVFDRAGNELAKDVVDTPHDRPETLVQMMRAVIAKTPVPISGAAVGVPGPISYRDGVPLRLPNLPVWEASISTRLLQEALGVRVLLANDADLAALGEYQFGAGKGCSDMVYVTSSTGVGAGVIMGGKLLHGHWSLAEAGHMIVDWRTGATVEHLGSGTALGRIAGEDGSAVAAKARAGDSMAIEAFEEVALAFATGVHNLVHCFMPERVVIGGGVSRAGDLLLDPVRSQLDACGKGCSVTGDDVVLAAGGDDVGLLGGLALWNEVGES
jgi:glucokinase